MNKEEIREEKGRSLPQNGSALTDDIRKEFQRETGLSENACKGVRTKEQANLFKELNLIDFDLLEIKISGNIKFPKDLPLKTKLKDMQGAEEVVGSSKWEEWKEWNNLELMGEGYCPIFPNCRERELNASRGEVHHDNQTQDTSYTILRKEDHDKYILHDDEESEINRRYFNLVRPLMLGQLVETLKEKFNGWDNIPDSFNKEAES